jgi:hypothetical protein
VSEHASMVARPEATWSSPPSDELVCAPYPEASSRLYLTPPALVTLPEPQESVDPGLSEPLTSGGDVVLWLAVGALVTGMLLIATKLAFQLLVQAAARAEALMRLHFANPPAAVITSDGRLR